VIQSMASERAVELACRLGEAQRAELMLLYVVEVPLTLPLTASMPDQEESGHDALETAKAIVARHNLPVSVRMIPERYAWDGILRVAAEENVDAIVMSLGVKRRRTGDEIGRTTQQVLRNAPCEVIVDKAPIPV
jgi:nucleotide-binding universal stress UspA family protein